MKSSFIIDDYKTVGYWCYNIFGNYLISFLVCLTKIYKGEINKNTTLPITIVSFPAPIITQMLNKNAIIEIDIQL